MRGYLFRGKRLDDGEWLFGFLLAFDENCGSILTVHCCESTAENPDGVFVEQDEIDMDTVGQYTGLTDKNGNKIFEGDILEYTSHLYNGSEITTRSVVIWDGYKWSEKEIHNERWSAEFNTYGRISDLYPHIAEKYGKIIGNIYDDPKYLV